MPTAPESSQGLPGRVRLRATGEALAWIAFGAVLWALTYSFDEASSAYRLGTTSWPRAVLVLLFACAVSQWLGALRKAPSTPPAPEQEQSSASGLSLSLFGVFGLPLVYAWLLPRTGFFATTPVFAALFFWLLGERVLWRLIVATATLCTVVLLVFSILLYVPLPTGNWPGFYDFSNFVLAMIR